MLYKIYRNLRNKSNIIVIKIPEGNETEVI